MFLETPFGSAQAYFLMTESDEIWWQCFQEETGESWWWPNNLVRLTRNISAHRYKTSEIRLSDELREALAPHMKRYE